MVQYSFWFSVPYILLLLVFYLLAYQEKQNIIRKKNLNIIHIWCGFLFLFFFGLRGFVGWDWYSYYSIFEYIPSLFHLSALDFDSFELLEPGYILYVAIIKLFTNNYHVFIFISVLIDYLLLNIIFNKYSKNVALAFTLLIGFSLTTEINLLRNFKAILIFLLALPYIKERKIVPYTALILLAMTFHVSAICYFPLYFFLHKKMPKGILIPLVLIGVILFIFQIHYITPFIQILSSLLGGKISLLSTTYLASDVYGEAQSISLRFIERMFSLGILIYYYDKIISKNQNNILFVNMFIIYILTTLYLFETVVLFDRISNLFIASYWFIYPIILDNIKLRVNKNFFLFFIVLYTLLVVYTHTNNILYRYDNVLFGISDYTTRQQYFNTFSSDLLDN